MYFLIFFSIFSLFADVHNNTVPARLQWYNNSGYCGETSLISAGLYYGQYLSQYDARALSTKGGLQTQCQLLIGVNDTKTADRMHLAYEEWDTDSEQTTKQFLVWLKQKVAKGNPVAIGVYINEYLFDGSTDPDAGDDDYDHIVSVVNVASSHPVTDPTYYGDDQIGFSDNGLWQNANTPVYYFTYGFDAFQKDREEANAMDGEVYSLANDASNYGIAITGVKDLNGDTLPICLDTDYNYEAPPIADGSNDRPAPMPLNLTITASNLEPNVPYILYRYNDLDKVPDSQFNANASNAFESWPFQITSGATYTQSEKIFSNEMAIYRCVRATAP